MNNLLKIVLKLILVLFPAMVFAQQDLASPIIPRPVKMLAGSGSFSWHRATKIIQLNGGKELLPAIDELKAISSQFTATALPTNVINLKLDPAIGPAEGYRLVIKKNGIDLHVKSVQAAFWAIASLKQLMGPQALTLHKTPLKKLSLPCLTIEDYPRFAWRGVHLDVSRHFFDMAYLHTMIDRMAYYKFNKFHLHLTDDQGWRLEIKKYPELTSKGAWRKLNNQDSVCMALAKTNPDYALPQKHFKMIDGELKYGGFYTQEEMKELIAYAEKKGIEIIPEIDMPGHMMAATTLMPWLTAKGKSGMAKDFTEPLCPCKETTYEFAQNVFSEIAALFPSKYIHLGADEVEKSSWKNVPACEELMKREGLKDLDELQSYFVRRMEKFFNEKGKKLIGWDEILDGGVSSTAAMMYWRTWMPKAPKMAAEKGLELIMTPGEYCYFDAQQDGGSLQKVYGFDPYNYNLTASERKMVKGVQANIWTEYIPSERRLEYMVFPRLLALAEVAWNKNEENWVDFDRRLQVHTQLMGAMNINYRMPDIKGFAEKSVFVDSTYLMVKKPFKEMMVRYTVDGTEPGVNAQLLPDKLLVKKPVQLKIAGFISNGNKSDVYTIDYEKQPYLKGVKVNSPKNGLKFYYYPVAYKNAKSINEKDLALEKVVQTVEIPLKETAPSFATKHVGYFYAATTGVYTFALRSDDGSILKIGDKVLIDNDGMHFSIEKSAQIALEKGYHPFELLFVEGGGGYTLQLQCKPPNGLLKPIASTSFAH